MSIKRLTSLVMFFGVVLFSYAAASAQDTTTTTTTTSTNPRVVVTDNLSKPSTPANQPATAKTTTTKIGNFNINVTEGVTGQNLENGKFLTITKWDGTKWVTKREWVPNNPSATKPNPQ
jgi:hypothetical protein